MSALKKSDPNKTAELEIPEELLKSVKALKKEQGAIGEALAHAKQSITTEASRKHDESTRVFTLRKTEMIDKIKTLEIKKAQVEKEINAILQQKNLSVHEDLRKATAFILEETRKIAPIEKELESKVRAISHLKTEMQVLFESATAERHKNLEVLQAQGKEINHMSTLLSEATTLFKTEYKGLTGSVATLFEEKQVLTKDLTRLRGDLSASEVHLKKLQTEAAELEGVGELLRKSQARLDELMNAQKEYWGVEKKLQELLQEQRNLDASLNQKRSEKTHLTQEISRLGAELDQLEDRVLLKTLEVSELDSSLSETKKRIDQLRQEEIDCFRHLKREQERFSILQEDIARAESEKLSSHVLQEQATKSYHEKQVFFDRELALLESNLETKKSALEAEYLRKKSDWESEFAEFSRRKEEELQTQLAAAQAQDAENLRQRRRAFSQEVGNILKTQLTREDFATVEEKRKECQRQLEAVFTSFLGKRSWWKFW